MALQLFNKQLKFNNFEFIIPVRSDGYVNATALCKSVGKLFADWKRTQTAEELIITLGIDLSNMGIPILDLIITQVGGNHSGTFIHPDLAVPFAQWCSPSFSIQVGRWIRELMTTGKVDLNNQLFFS